MPTPRVQLFPAGYLLVTPPVQAITARGEPKIYCGVDRVAPFALDHASAIREFGEPATREDFLEACDAWFEARSERTAFIPSPIVATNLFRRFCAIGLSIELVYCELAIDANDQPRLADYALSAPPRSSTRLGFDTSWPGCNHSAIRQPSGAIDNRDAPIRLNQHGLAFSYAEAFILRDFYLKMYPYPPFDIYAVNAVHDT